MRLKSWLGIRWYLRGRSNKGRSNRLGAQGRKAQYIPGARARPPPIKLFALRIDKGFFYYMIIAITL